MLLLFIHSIAVTQSSPGNPSLDSAIAARAAWAQVGAAVKSGDSTVALRKAIEAARLWPTQPAYVWGSAIIAAQMGDTAAALDGLGRFADLGLGRDLRADPRLATSLTSPRAAAIIAKHDANRAPVARSTIAAKIADAETWPEGIDYDARTKSFLIASIRRGTIVEVRADGSTRDVIAPHASRVGAVMAVRVDPRSDVLWATTGSLRDLIGATGEPDGASELLQIRRSDGGILRRWTLGAPDKPHALGDIAIAPNGDVYVSDSQDPVLYRVRDGVVEAMTHPLFRSLQGIAFRDGRVAYVADYSHGLLRIDLETKAVARVADAPHSTTLGMDGIVYTNGAIIGVQNGVAPARVVRLRLSSDSWSITGLDVLDQHPAIADEPTTGVMVGDDFLYLANSQWEKVDAAGRLKAGAPAVGPIILRVAVPRW